jgi:hypothetical protein
VPVPAATGGLFAGVIFFGLREVRRGQKRLAAMITAKVEGPSVAFSVEGRRFIHYHSANGVFCHIRLDSGNSWNASTSVIHD